MPASTRDSAPSMSEQSQPKLTKAPTERPQTLADTGLGSFDMSMGTVPENWVEAQHESPTAEGDSGAFTNKSARFNTIPTGHQSTFIENVAALGASFVTGSLWYICEVLNLYRGPWIAVALGAVIALAVRFAGNSGPSYRAVLTVASYLLTLLLVLILITHRELTDIYGGVSEFQSYEQTLVRTRLQDPTHLVAYGLGGFLAAQIAYVHRPNR